MADIKIRSIPVHVGDVFGGYTLLVVVGMTKTHATVRNRDTGRRTSVMKRRLQLEYPRASERIALAARKALARLDAQTKQREAVTHSRRKTHVRRWPG